MGGWDLSNPRVEEALIQGDSFGSTLRELAQAPELADAVRCIAPAQRRLDRMGRTAGWSPAFLHQGHKELLLLQDRLVVAWLRVNGMPSTEDEWERARKRMDDARAVMGKKFSERAAEHLDEFLAYTATTVSDECQAIEGGRTEGLLSRAVRALGRWYARSKS